MKIAVYPGSFDPFTAGHMDVLKRASDVADVVYAAILTNSAKKPVFTVEERMAIIEGAAKELGLENVRTATFDGLLVEFAKSIGARYIIRGLRAVTDFEYEFQIDAMNRRLAPEIDTVYFMANPEHSFLSSSMVKEVASYGGDISGLVPKEYEKLIAERLLKR